MSARTITLTVDRADFFDEVSKYGLINSTCPIGSRVIACLLGGVDFREAAGLGCYGVQVFEGLSALSSEPGAGGGIEGASRADLLGEEPDGSFASEGPCQSEGGAS